MAICKCKMCGGDLNVEADIKVIKCEYCGTTQTVPSADNEKKLKLFNRANHLRLISEFDKAAGVYESIIADFPEEAEAYWGLCLCNYGVEYVDDPATGDKIPTCHRSSFNSIFDSVEFDMIMENADAVARNIYRQEAKAIENIRKTIIDVSTKEEPYDIFICYKETDEKGERTLDSLIAQDIYNELSSKGYKVFFSRISLEDKLGEEYEPYIFAALNSAKIMLVFGTDYEHFNAVWVKNEWSRFLKLIEKGEKKTLIPCYKNVDIYDIPKEFARLQAQDMGKIGAVQDLLRGIEKIIGTKSSASATEDIISVGTEEIVNNMLKKAYGFLEVGDWLSSEKCLETVLGYDPQNVSALIGCLMHKHKVTREQYLADVDVILEEEEYYNLAFSNADEKTKAQLVEYNLSSLYNYGNLLAQKRGKASRMKAMNIFERLHDYKDAEEKLKNLKKKQKRSVMLKLMFLIAVVIVAITAVAKHQIDRYNKNLSVYNDAISLMENGYYTSAKYEFKNLVDFKDSADMIIECDYLDAKRFTENYDPLDKTKNYQKYTADSTLELLEGMTYYKDSQQLIYELKYKLAEYHCSRKEYNKALLYLIDLKDSRYEAGEKRLETVAKETYSKAVDAYNSGNWGTARTTLEVLSKIDYCDSAEMFDKCIKNIDSERSAFNGVWLEAKNIGTNLKIDENGVYEASQANTKKDNWNKLNYKYNEDTGVISFEYGTQCTYDAKVNGDTLKITCTSSSDWFGNKNVFYRKK